MKSLLIVQPSLMHYRVAVYNDVASELKTTVVHSANRMTAVPPYYFQSIRVKCINVFGIKWQRGLFSTWQKSRPDVVWIAADLNYVSSIFFSLYCRARGTKVILHGQGIVKSSRHKMLRRLLLRFWFRIGHKYIAYANPCAESLVNTGFPKGKINVICNRFQYNKTHSGNIDFSVSGVLFSGRLRRDSGIELLIKTMQKINSKRSVPVALHIIGDGAERDLVKKAAPHAPWMVWHGELIDAAKIERIGRACCIGVYPGKAGLSVLTYMQVGLAVVVGNDLSLHKGPEPSYVEENIHGWKFDPRTPDDFERVLLSAITHPNLDAVRRAAYSRFRELHKKAYGREMVESILS